MNSVSIYVAAQALTILSTVSIALFITIKGRQKETARLYAIYNLTIAGWAFSWAQMALATSPQAGNFWARFLHVPAAFIPATFFHFVQFLTRAAVKKRLAILAILYIAAGVFAGLSFHSSALVASTTSKTGLLYFPKMGTIYPSFVAFFLVVYLVSFMILLFAYRRSTGQLKTQIFYVLLAYLIGLSGGAQAFLPVVSDMDIPEYAFFLIPVGQALIGYAIFRHQLLQTQLIVRRIALFVAIYAALIVLTVPTLYFFHHQGQPISGASYSFIESILVGGILSVGPFLYAYFVKSGSYFKEYTMSGLTHELKSPLSIIEGALEAMQMQKLNGTSNKVEYVEMMERNTVRLKNLVNDLLVVFGSKDLTMSISKKQVYIDYLISEAIKIHSDAAQKKGLPIIKKLPNVPILVNCDQSRIIQVLSNLLSNALKFTDTGYIEVKAEPQNDSIFISVSDTGCGITDEDLPFIFDRFYQGQIKRSGSGIGLYIAKLWVEAHGGRIWAKPQENRKGCSVAFIIN